MVELSPECRHDREPVLRLLMFPALAVTLTAAVAPAALTDSRTLSPAPSLHSCQRRRTAAARTRRGAHEDARFPRREGSDHLRRHPGACTADVFAARIRDIERFKASEYVLQSVDSSRNLRSRTSPE